MSGNTLLENSSSFDKKDDLFLLGTLLIFTLFFRLFMLQMINVGPDEIDYWYCAKMLITGGEYPEIMHRTIRWSLILPTALTQLIFGTHGLVYYIPAVVNSLIQTVVMYFLGKKLFNRGISFLAVLLFTAWPYMWRTGSQIRPAVFSLTYVLAAVYTLFLFLENRRTRDLILSAVFLFLAYQSKITNLYLVPGILILLWRRDRRFGDPVKYGGILFLFYIIEHLGYWIFTGNKMGRLGIIAGHHMKGDFADKLPSGFLGLFARYTDYMELPWKLLFLSFIAATVYLLIKKKRWIIELTILHVSFFFFLTFMVKSISPIQPVEPFLDRYYIINLPAMCLIIVYAVVTLLPDGVVDFFFRKAILTVLAGLLVLLVVIATALPLPSGAARFFTPLKSLERHPIPMAFRFHEVMERAVGEDLPVISVDTRKPADTANRVFFDSKKKGRSAAEIEMKTAGDHKVYLLKGAGEPQDLSNPDQEVLWCDRFNFDLKITALRDIPLLADFYSLDS